MAIPVAYNLRSAKERWTSSVVAVLGIAGTVGVFVAMLALARGFKAALVSSGLPQNAIVQRGGSDTAMTSIISMDDVRVVEDAPQVARRGNEPLVSPEVVVIAPLPLRDTGTDANVSVRGVSPRVLAVRDTVHVGQSEALFEADAGRVADVLTVERDLAEPAGGVEPQGRVEIAAGLQP